VCGVPITLGTNIASLNAQRRVSDSTDRLSTISERLASGQRINRASDDAAGLAVASSLNARARIYTQASRNLSDGVSALNIADQAVGNLAEIVTRQQELAAQAANGVYSTAQRRALDTEAQALSQEYARIVATTQFNNINLLDGSNASVALQIGIGNGSILSSKILDQSVTSSSNTTDAGTTTDSTLAFGGLSHIDDQRFLIVDLNNDGIQDIAAFALTDTAGTRNAKYDMRVVLGKASGGFSTFDYVDSQSFLGGSVGSHVASTSMTFTTALNGDGYYDIIGHFDINYSAGTDYSADQSYDNTTGQNGGIFQLQSNFNFTYGDQLTSGGVSVADFNGDGFSDDLTISGSNFIIGIHNTTTTNTTTVSTQNVSQSSISLLTQSSARSAMDSLQTVADKLGQVRGNIGASLSRAASASNVLSVTSTNYSAAESRIMSADIASESSDLVRTQILQQTGAAVLAQANQQPAIALKLLNA